VIGMREAENHEKHSAGKTEAPARPRQPFSPSPSSLFLLATFPGVLLHQILIQLLCRFLRVAIFEVRYFEPGANLTGGAVVHEKPLWASHQILLVIGPFLAGSLLGALVALPAAVPVVWFGAGGLLDYFLLWLGFSLAVNALPTPEEAGTLRHLLADPRLSAALRLIGLPAARLIALVMGGSLFWRRALYGIALTLLLPAALVWLLGLA
jgi:hypothetical protein